MSLRSGRGITAASLNGRQTAYKAGQPIGSGRDVTYSNPFLAQISTLTLAAVSDVSDEIVADQVWTITLTDPDGVAYETEHTVTAADNTAGTDGDGLAYMATTLAAALEANVEIEGLIDASASAAVITITWKQANQGTWTVAAVCTPAAAEAVLTATAATSQTAGGTTLPMARFVAFGTPVPEGAGGPGRRASLPSAVTSVIGGISLYDLTETRPYDTTSTAVNTYAVGSLVNVREQGEVAMENVSSVAAIAGGPVYCVVSTTGGDALGEARSDAAGTADVWTLTPTAANSAVFGVQVYFPEWNGQSSKTFVFGNFTSDADGTATEISTGISDQMDADVAFSALVTATGTATIILTGRDLGRPFVVTDVAEAGDFTSVTHTTTAAMYTVLVPRARWTIPTAASAIGRVHLLQ
jgi:hypothetical protein